MGRPSNLRLNTSVEAFSRPNLLIGNQCFMINFNFYVDDEQ